MFRHENCSDHQILIFPVVPEHTLWYSYVFAMTMS